MNSWYILELFPDYNFISANLNTAHNTIAETVMKNSDQIGCFMEKSYNNVNQFNFGEFNPKYGRELMTRFKAANDQYNNQLKKEEKAETDQYIENYDIKTKEVEQKVAKYEANRKDGLERSKRNMDAFSGLDMDGNEKKLPTLMNVCQAPHAAIIVLIMK